MQSNSYYRLRIILAASVLSLLLLFPACENPFTEKQLELKPVSGKITFDGEPIAGAKVVFLPRKLFVEQSLPHPPATAITDDEGAFHLKTDGADGAPTGDYLVLISKRDDKASGKEPDLSLIELTRDLDELKNKLLTEPWMSAETIPSFYNGQTRLRFTVPPRGTTHADFQLSISELPLERAGNSRN